MYRGPGRGGSAPVRDWDTTGGNGLAQLDCRVPENGPVRYSAGGSGRAAYLRGNQPVKWVTPSIRRSNGIIVASMAWKLHTIEQTQLRGQRRFDGVERPKFDFHTQVRAVRRVREER